MKHILIIDDAKEVRFLLSRLFEEQDVKVSVAKNGIEGIEAFEKNKPDMVFSDIEMPEMGGIPFAKYIYENHQTRISLITATPLDVLPEEYFYSPGVKNIIHKSAFVEDITPMLNELNKRNEQIPEL